MDNMKKDLGQKPVAGKDSESLSHKAGDAIERIGDKLKKSGAEKIGQAIHDAGDRLEHSGDRQSEKQGDKKNDSF